MKNFLVVLLALGCGAILFTGYLHWKDKTVVSTGSVEQKVESKENAEKKKSGTSLEQLTANWPEKARDQYKLALENDEPFTILIAGSNALGYEEDGWSVNLKSQLEEVYGDTIKVKVKSYDITSVEFILQNKLDELVSEEPDLTLLEPFTLNDNGNVQFNDSHLHIKEIADGLKKANPNHVLLLQPPYPLHQANFYPVEVEALKDFADEMDIPYLDHWSAWPDPDSDEILEYLTIENDTTTVNEKGHQLWADYLTDYFIAK
jgi:hypothetical protein